LATDALARGHQRDDAIAFALTSVRPAHRDHLRVTLRPAELLSIEWPLGESEPARYWLSTLPAGTDVAELVRLAKIRWRIERDYQELKDENRTRSL
jgi:SRSO17 transposase